MSAEGSQHKIGLVAESTYGTTPSSPTFETVRHTGTTLAMQKDTFASDERRDDRQIAHFRHGTRAPAGDISFELSYGGVFDTLLEAALGGTWAESGASGSVGDVLKVGTTRRSFSMERFFGDATAAGGDLYQLFTGVEVDTLSLTVTPNGIVTGSFGLMAQDMATDTASAGSYNSPTTADPFDAFSGSISEGGSSIAIVTEVTLNLSNGLQRAFVIGQETSDQTFIGRSNVTGSLSARFESNALLDKFINETGSSLEFSLTDGTNTYTFECPNIKYTGGETPVSDDGPILVNLPFQALYDATDATNLMITR